MKMRTVIRARQNRQNQCVEKISAANRHSKSQKIEKKRIFEQDGNGEGEEAEKGSFNQDCEK